MVRAPTDPLSIRGGPEPAVMIAVEWSGTKRRYLSKSKAKLGIRESFARESPRNKGRHVERGGNELVRSVSAADVRLGPRHGKEEEASRQQPSEAEISD